MRFKHKDISMSLDAEVRKSIFLVSKFRPASDWVPIGRVLSSAMTNDIGKTIGHPFFVSTITSQGLNDAE